MTIQELAKAYKEVDADTLDFIESVLLWRRNAQFQQDADVLEVWRRLKTLLRKEDEVSSVNSIRQAVQDENTQLIRQKNEIKKEVESLRQKNEEIEAEINELRREKERFNSLKQDHADLEKDKAKVQTELDEMRRKCKATKDLVDAGQKSGWLKRDEKDKMQQIWNTLPLDTLDAFLKEK